MEDQLSGPAWGLIGMLATAFIAAFVKGINFLRSGDERYVPRREFDQYKENLALQFKNIETSLHGINEKVTVGNNARDQLATDVQKVLLPRLIGLEGRIQATSDSVAQLRDLVNKLVERLG